MKKLLYAAASAVAMMAMAPSANAATFINVDGLNGAFDLSLDYTIGAGPVDISIISLGGADVDFTSVSFGAQSLTVVNDIFATIDTAVLFPPIAFAAGTYTLRLIGTSTAGGAFTGVLNSAPAVPEPATWAMMLAGVAAVGTAMRRRSYSSRVSFS
jgi:hypothetical protein